MLILPQCSSKYKLCMLQFPLFVIGTTLYINMSALPFGLVFSVLLTNVLLKLTCLLFYVDMRMTLNNVYMLQESLILCKHWHIVLSLILKKKHNFQHFLLYTYCRNTYPKGRALMLMYRVVPITGTVCVSSDVQTQK